MSQVYLHTVMQGQKREFRLDTLPVCRIGRGEQSSIVLTGDVKVSRNHAVVQRMDTGEYYLTDLGSRNGTVLNGRLVVSPTSLRNGDIIRLDCHEGVLEAKVPDAIWQQRETPSLHHAKNEFGSGRELFASLRRAAGDAEAGAISLL